jgi:hypothetical protein
MYNMKEFTELSTTSKRGALQRTSHVHPSQSMIAHWGRRSVKTQSDSLVFRGHVTKSISGKGIERPEVRRRFLYV